MLVSLMALLVGRCNHNCANETLMPEKNKLLQANEGVSTIIARILI